MKHSFKIPHDISSYEYSNILTNILSRRNKAIEMYIGQKILEVRKLKPRIRRSLGDSDIFRIKAFITGADISIKTLSQIDIPLRIAANPSIAVIGTSVHIYIRVSSLGSHPIPNPWSRTFIAYARLDLDKLHGRLSLNAIPLLYPYTTIERIEDPRIYFDQHELYHVRAIELYQPIGGARSFVTTFIAELKEPFKVENLEILRFKWIDGDEYIIRDYRDTFPLNDQYMIVRPRIEEIGIGTIGVAPRRNKVVEINEVKFYPELIPTDNEAKTGSNCVTKLSSNEYLLIFHSVDKVFGCYYTYAAILSSDGDLLAVTPQPILSPKIHDYFGARPGTIFVCGAQIINEKLVLSAGKDDEIVLILEADIDEVIERMKFIKG